MVVKNLIKLIDRKDETTITMFDQKTGELVYDGLVSKVPKSYIDLEILSITALEYDFIEIVVNNHEFNE